MTKVKTTVGFWLVLAAAIVTRQGYSAALYAVAMFLHEAAHFVVAKKLLYNCTEIRLGAFGAVLYGDFQDLDAVDRIKIALAGPLFNFSMCVVCLALWWSFPDTYYFSHAFFQANASMGCVNLLPCYPLDGGRVFTGVAQTATGKNCLNFVKALTCAVGFAGLLLCVFLPQHRLYNVGVFSVCLLLGVVCQSGGECYTRTTLVQSKQRLLKRGMEKKTLVFCEESTLREVAKRMKGNYLFCLEVVDEDMNVRQRYGVAQLEKLILQTPLDTPLCQLKKG